MSTLVTGGAGFIGSNLVEDLLASGEEELSWTTCTQEVSVTWRA